MARQFQTFRTAGSGRYAELCAEQPAPHRPSPMPAPDAAHFRRLAEDKRREAAGIVRHIRPNDLGPGPSFARRQAEDLYRQADEYEALAEQLAGGAS